MDQPGALAGSIETAGFESIWVTDRHPSNGSPMAGTSVLEAYSLLGALSICAHALHLAVIPSGLDRRAPSIVGKIVTGIDVISHGRGMLTFGVDGDDPYQVARLTEALQVARSLLDDEAPKFAGSFYTLDGAFNRPSPVQSGGVPVVVVLPENPTQRKRVWEAAVGLADAAIVRGRLDDIRTVAGWRSVTEQERDVADLTLNGDAPQVIDIGHLRDGVSSSRPAPWPEAALPAGSVEDVYAVGADGCIVPIDINDAPEEIHRLAVIAGEGG
jgi:alkanesulfonate monooxygenase SsuD/methylene tetrahydromethanopterin reductase-like flavin-dependent oxidoreductase (luciferase family)